MGSAHVAKGHMGAAETELANIRTQMAADGVNDNGVAPTPASHVLNLAAHALNGEIEEANGNLDASIAHYNVAIELQDNLNYTEPPDWPQSVRLYLGAVLLEAGFLTNKEDQRALADPKTHVLLADAIRKACLAYDATLRETPQEPEKPREP